MEHALAQTPQDTMTYSYEDRLALANAQNLNRADSDTIYLTLNSIYHLYES
jgi:hypothetical protein